MGHSTHDPRTGRIDEDRLPLLRAMIADGKTAGEMADLLNVNPETIRKFARKRGLTIYHQPQTMENHPAWKSGTVKDRSGYLLQRVLKDGPHGYLIRAIAKRGAAGTDSTGYAPVHRIAMHDKLGRKLQPGEVVDHIDGNHLNNDPSNLRVFGSNADHLRETLKGRVPQWTPEGWAKMQEAVSRPRKKRSSTPVPEPTHGHPKSDDPASP